MIPMKRYIYVVRHGATEWNKAGRIQGQLDVPINAEGRNQAALAAQSLTAVNATALYSSDLLRTFETAQIIGQQTGLQVIQKPNLREIHFGQWQGLTSQEICQRDPDIYAARREYPHTIPPPGGESWRHFYHRAIQAVQQILRVSDAQHLIISTHSGVCTALGLEALGLGYKGNRPFGSANCAIHTIAIENQQWEAIALNDVSHLGIE